MGGYAAWPWRSVWVKSGYQRRIHHLLNRGETRNSLARDVFHGHRWPAADPVIGLLITIAILGVLRTAARDVFRRLLDCVDPALVDATRSPRGGTTDHWARHLAAAPQPATGRPAAAATIARRLSCLSGFYDYGLREVELLEYSPVANVRRPRVSEDSPHGRVVRRRAGPAARRHRTPLAAVRGAGVPAGVHGLRIDEALACEVASLTYHRGRRVLRITRKGGRARSASALAVPRTEISSRTPSR